MKPAGVLNEHRLAREEVSKVHADVDPRIEALLEGELDAQAHRDTASVHGPPVHRLHDPWPSAGNDGVSGPGQPCPDVAGHLVLRGVSPHAGRAEDADCWAQLGESAEPLDELRLNS